MENFDIKHEGDNKINPVYKDIEDNDTIVMTFVNVKKQSDVQNVGLGFKNITFPAFNSSLQYSLNLSL